MKYCLLILLLYLTSNVYYCILVNSCINKPCEECGGRRRLTKLYGVISDGTRNYKSSSNCTWVYSASSKINNSINSTIYLTIKLLSTECGWDYLYVHDGDSMFSPVIATLSGHKSANTLRNFPKLVATSGSIFIHFFSDETYVQSGFLIYYWLGDNYRYFSNCSNHGRLELVRGGRDVACSCDANWFGTRCHIPLSFFTDQCLPMYAILKNITYNSHNDQNNEKNDIHNEYGENNNRELLIRPPICQNCYSDKLYPWFLTIIEQNSEAYVHATSNGTFKSHTLPLAAGHALIATSSMSYIQDNHNNNDNVSLLIIGGYNFNSHTEYFDSIFASTSQANNKQNLKDGPIPHLPMYSMNLNNSYLQWRSLSKYIYGSNDDAPSTNCFFPSMGHTAIYYNNFIYTFGGHDLIGQFAPINHSLAGLQIFSLRTQRWVCSNSDYDLEFSHLLKARDFKTSFNNGFGNNSRKSYTNDSLNVKSTFFLEIPLTVTDHTAHIIKDYTIDYKTANAEFQHTNFEEIKHNQANAIMVVIFGYNPTYGFLPYVQEYYLGNNSWRVIGDDPDEFSGAVVQGRAAHTSALDYYDISTTSGAMEGGIRAKIQNPIIYVFGGLITTPFHSAINAPSSGLYSYDPIRRYWRILESAPYRIHSHTMVAYKGLLITYGGQSTTSPSTTTPSPSLNNNSDDKTNHNNTSKQKFSCISSKFMAYHIESNTWNTLPTSTVSHLGERIGHSSVMIDDLWYIHGGYNGVILGAQTIVLNFTTYKDVCFNLTRTFLHILPLTLRHFNITLLNDDKLSSSNIMQGGPIIAPDVNLNYTKSQRRIHQKALQHQLNLIKWIYTAYVSQLFEEHASNFRQFLLLRSQRNTSTNQTDSGALEAIQSSLISSCLLELLKFDPYAYKSPADDIVANSLNQKSFSPKLREYCYKLAKTLSSSSINYNEDPLAHALRDIPSTEDLASWNSRRIPKNAAKRYRLGEHLENEFELLSNSVASLKNDALPEIYESPPFRKLSAHAIGRLPTIDTMSFDSSSMKKESTIDQFEERGHHNFLTLYQKFVGTSLYPSYTNLASFDSKLESQHNFDVSSFMPRLDNLNTTNKRKVREYRDTNRANSSDNLSTSEHFLGKQILSDIIRGILEIPTQQDNFSEMQTSFNSLSSYPLLNHGKSVSTSCLKLKDCSSCLATSHVDRCVWCPYNNIGCISVYDLIPYNFLNKDNISSTLSLACPLIRADVATDLPSSIKTLGVGLNANLNINSSSYPVNNVVNNFDDLVYDLYNEENISGQLTQTAKHSQQSMGNSLEAILAVRASPTGHPSQNIFEGQIPNPNMRNIPNSNENSHEKHTTRKPIIRPSECPIWSRRICEMYTTCYSCHANPVCLWALQGRRYQCITLFMVKDSMVTLYNPQVEVRRQLDLFKSSHTSVHGVIQDHFTTTNLISTVATSISNLSTSTSTTPNHLEESTGEDNTSFSGYTTHTFSNEKRPYQRRSYRYCNSPCDSHADCLNCTKARCLWCTTFAKCIDSSVYTLMYPYGQCFAWYSAPTQCPGYLKQELMKSLTVDDSIYNNKKHPYTFRLPSSPSISRSGLDYGGSHLVDSTAITTYMDKVQSRLTDVLNYMKYLSGFHPDRAPLLPYTVVSKSTNNNASTYTLNNYSETPYKSSTSPIISSYLSVGRELMSSVHFYEICSKYFTCQTCQLDPGCGWCNHESNTGRGTCLPGGLKGPLDRKDFIYHNDLANTTSIQQNYNQICRDWYFWKCPACQCNGHSICLTTSPKLKAPHSTFADTTTSLSSASHLAAPVTDARILELLQKYVATRAQYHNQRDFVPIMRTLKKRNYETSELVDTESAELEKKVELLHCAECMNHTVGPQCQYCDAGFYGNALNNGLCKPCICNGQTTMCDSTTGACHCTTKGVIGSQCQFCDTEKQYVGDPTKPGGTCYYNLTTDYIFTFNMTLPEDQYLTRLNMLNRLTKPENSIEFKIACSGHPKINISYIKDDSGEEITILGNQYCMTQFLMEIDAKYFTPSVFTGGSFHRSQPAQARSLPSTSNSLGANIKQFFGFDKVKEKPTRFNKDKFQRKFVGPDSEISRQTTATPINGNDLDSHRKSKLMAVKGSSASTPTSTSNTGYTNITFYIHVYDFEVPSWVLVSFSNTPKLDILQFFITFLSCFLFLLFVAAVGWKIKQKYDLYRRRQRLFIEMEQMATRPFTSTHLYLESRPPAFYVRKRRKNRPTPIAIEPLIDEASALLSVVVRLPTDQDKWGNPITPYGASGIVFGTTLVSMATLNLAPLKPDPASQLRFDTAAERLKHVSTNYGSRRFSTNFARHRTRRFDHLFFRTNNNHNNNNNNNGAIHQTRNEGHQNRRLRVLQTLQNFLTLPFGSPNQTSRNNLNATRSLPRPSQERMISPEVPVICQNNVVVCENNQTPSNSTNNEYDLPLCQLENYEKPLAHQPIKHQLDTPTSANMLIGSTSNSVDVPHPDDTSFHERIAFVRPYFKALNPFRNLFSIAERNSAVQRTLDPNILELQNRKPHGNVSQNTNTDDPNTSEMPDIVL